MGLLKYLLCFSFNHATCGGTLSTIRKELTSSFEIKYATRFLPMKPQPASRYFCKVRIPCINHFIAPVFYLANMILPPKTSTFGLSMLMIQATYKKAALFYSIIGTPTAILLLSCFCFCCFRSSVTIIVTAVCHKEAVIQATLH